MLKLSVHQLSLTDLKGLNSFSCGMHFFSMKLWESMNWCLFIMTGSISMPFFIPFHVILCLTEAVMGITGVPRIIMIITLSHK